MSALFSVALKFNITQKIRNFFYNTVQKSCQTFLPCCKVLLSTSSPASRFCLFCFVFLTWTIFHSFTVQSFYLTIFRVIFWLLSRLTHTFGSFKNKKNKPSLNCIFGHFVTSSMLQKYIFCSHFFS